MTAIFKPSVGFRNRRDPPESFQVAHFRINGPLGTKAAMAARAYNMTQSQFTVAAIEFALDHMEEQND